MNINTEHGTYKDVYFMIGKYRADDSLNIQIWNQHEGPIATLTVCLCKQGMKENEAYVDTNNCPWAVEFIEKEKLGVVVGFGISGYCTYPLVRFNMEQVRLFERQD